ncbi:hypothetical protein SAMN05421812_1357 [Asanoa hainanensis]|uniref:DUF1266 domain-containing protein n=1 Tax=Asanoa hainanensis TaxID=560556 RepID=A0A239PGG3_9ACTN|nr:hypothetical protein [Asanoa hainanensis]SNT66226.1 hypothetical protein SAMN05421812_1357 [Asanoa hainanensis]
MPKGKAIAAPGTVGEAIVEITSPSKGASRRRVRLGSVALLVTGIGLAVLGQLGDNTDFWADRPFSTNLYTGIVSACFGVPLALGVLHRVSARLADEALNAREQADTTAALQRLHSSAEGIDRLRDSPGTSDRGWEHVVDDSVTLWLGQDDFDGLQKQLQGAEIGFVLRSARDIQRDWLTLRAAARNAVGLHVWERSFTFADARGRSFDDLLASFAGGASYGWWDHFAQADGSSPHSRANEFFAGEALRWVCDAGLVMEAILGRDAVDPAWRKARDLWDDRRQSLRGMP